MTLGPVLIGISSTTLTEEEQSWLQHPAVGGVVLFARNIEAPEQVSALCDAIRQARDERLLITVDQEGGRVQRLQRGFTRLPPLAVLGELYDKDKDTGLDFAYRHGRVMAQEVLLAGIDLSFAPVMDLNGGSLVIGDRSASASPETVTRLIEAYIAGMHDAGMKATGKHFPGHGSCTADSHTHDVLDKRSRDSIYSTDLKPFTALASTLDAIMMAHVVYPAVDSRPAGYSTQWTQAILRQELGFKGTIFSDDLGMHAAKVAGTLLERAIGSLQGGCDLVLVCDPDDTREILGQSTSWPDASAAIIPLYGSSQVSRNDLNTVSEWRQWQRSLSALV